jgi:hypothetical protein
MIMTTAYYRTIYANWQGGYYGVFAGDEGPFIINSARIQLNYTDIGSGTFIADGRYQFSTSSGPFTFTGRFSGIPPLSFIVA